MKAGVLDDGQMFDTPEGTPQGGVISPLLANIALHGMEELVKEYAGGLVGRKKENQSSVSLIRYADDFVILAPRRFNIETLHLKISKWLAKMGLELSPSKTKIGHTQDVNQKFTPGVVNSGVEVSEKDGFDFLGFNVRQYEVGKHHSGKKSNKELLGFKTLIKPSNQAIKRHYEVIAEITDAHKSAPQEALISRLNPVIRGWVNYYSTVVSKETFSHLDHLVYTKLARWAKRRHPQKSGAWVSNRYWNTVGDNNWVFSTTKDGKVAMSLTKHSHKEIVRHVKVQGIASPFDGNLKYWSSRMGKNPLMPTRVATLLKKQKGKCTHCRLYFQEDDLIEVDHIIPKSQGGKENYDNLQALHRHCHDVKTANDNRDSKLENSSVDKEWLPW